MERNVCLRISPVQVSLPSSSKDQPRVFSDHIYCSSLVKTSMVHRSSATLAQTHSFFHCDQIRWPSLKEKFCILLWKTCNASSRMVTLREGLHQKRFSEGVSIHNSKAIRQFSGTVYDDKWSISNQCLCTPISRFSSFFLFEEKNLVLSTMKSYKSEIYRTLIISGGPGFYKNDHLSNLMRKFDDRNRN